MVKLPLIFILTFSILAETVISLSIEQPCQDFIETYVETEKPKICNTPGCVRAAYTLLQNMDSTAEPCEDFYQYACGGFVEKVNEISFLHIFKSLSNKRVGRNFQHACLLEI